MCILDDIMEQTRCDTDDIEFHIRQDTGHFKGMGQIGFTGKANLPVMNPGRINIGAVNDVQVHIRVIFGYFIDNIVNTDHVLKSVCFGKDHAADAGTAATYALSFFGYAV